MRARRDAGAVTWLALLAAASAVLLAVRLFAARHVGFGDAEALYASYALHPQPAYLDHPGLVGVFARLVGGGSAPSPGRAHLVTALLATLFPWAMALACRACGAPWSRAFAAALLVAFCPEIAVGLFAMTPDLLLALAWTGALTLAAAALASPAGGARAAACFAGAGLLAGVAAGAHLSGLLLVASLAVAYGTRPARPHARTIAPWAGLAAGLLVFAPVVLFEARTGWPMLRHRLLDTQPDAGLSLRNAGAFVGGQLVYLSPLVAALAVLAARDAWQDRGDAAGALLLACAVLPAAVLVPLCLWSRVAEPHWFAPVLLALVPAAARARPAHGKLAIAADAVAALMTAAAHAWALAPSAPHLAPAGYDARVDLTNELYGWPEVVKEVREAAADAWMPGARRRDLAVVGPHWVVCAQLEAALRGELPVGCDTPVRDDFDDWWPRRAWRRAETIVWVSDERFPGGPELPDYAVWRMSKVRVRRGGVVVRTFTVTTWGRRAIGFKRSRCRGVGGRVA